MQTSQASFVSRFTAFMSVVIIGLGSCAAVALEADPFRTKNARAIEQNTGLAFKALFEQGNYQDAEYYLREAKAKNPQEPMTYAMLAAFAYQRQDWSALKSHAAKTLETAQTLVSQGELLRGNLYLAMGHFLEGSYILVTEGTLKGAPSALQKLQEVFDYLDAAQKVDRDDPELSLIKGYMTLLLSLNLPFSSPEEAILTLEKGSPRYLAYRGIAIAYRDLNKYQEALNFVDKALAETPNHPEVLYLKAQILLSLAKAENSPQRLKESTQFFAQALRHPERLPKQTVAQIFYEQCKALNRLDNRGRSCDPLRDQIKAAQGFFGPVGEKLPVL
ncbi:MAG: Sll0314/Alr1548 family TPR repeat-containing protein [Microcoleaceae cyanobacterium]